MKAQTYLTSTILLVALLALFNTEDILVEFFATMAVFFTGIALGQAIQKKYKI